MEQLYKEISECRCCGNRNLYTVLDLGTHSLSGVFPNTPDQSVARGPIELVKCDNHNNGEFCGLVQLKQTYNLTEMYGANYGYRSGLNLFMKAHLAELATKIKQTVTLNGTDLIVDIGSNDATLLKNFIDTKSSLVGVDPTAIKFQSFYPPEIDAIPDFYPSELFNTRYRDRKAKVITSIAMLYDLEKPLEFMQQIADTLSSDGIWLFEQSYLPDMMAANSYDTICHEHLEYYDIRQIHWMSKKCGIKLIINLKAYLD